MKVMVRDIKINDRIRRDYGDIEELAADIKENGLINPILITQDMQLIAGERRLKALMSLGIDEIEANIMTVSDAFHKLRLEISENEHRKDFTFSEKMTWAARLKEEHKEIARKNSLHGLINRNNPDAERIQPMGRVDDIVAKKVGLGTYRNFAKAEYIINNADDEMIKQLDANQLSINKAYNQLRAEKDRLMQEHNDLAMRLERQVEKNDKLENDIETLKNSESIDYIEKIDELKARERKQYEQNQELKKKLAAAERMRQKNDEYLQEVEAQLEEERAKTAELMRNNLISEEKQEEHSIRNLIQILSKFYGDLNSYVISSEICASANESELAAVRRCVDHTLKLINKINDEVCSEVDSRIIVA